MPCWSQGEVQSPRTSPSQKHMAHRRISSLKNLLQEVRIKRASEMLDPLSRSVLGWRDDREPSRRGYVREHRHSFSTLWVAQINFHSASHARSPRRANLLAPRASLIWPNTGSTIPALLA